MALSRRRFLLYTAGFAGAPFTALLAQPRFDKSPFTLGVASGYPTPTGVVLWTRLAPNPLAGGGMPQAAVEVGWEIAADESFRNIVQRGTEPASPEWAHSVHAEVSGLEPGPPFFLPPPRGRRGAPHRRAPARAGAGVVGAFALRLGVLSAVRAGLLPRLPPHGPGGPGSGGSPGRLHLRVLVGPPSRTQARRRGAEHSR